MATVRSKTRIIGFLLSIVSLNSSVIRTLITKSWDSVVGIPMIMAVNHAAQTVGIAHFSKMPSIHKRIGRVVVTGTAIVYDYSN